MALVIRPQSDPEKNLLRKHFRHGTWLKMRRGEPYMLGYPGSPLDQSSRPVIRARTGGGSPKVAQTFLRAGTGVCGLG